MPPQSCRVLQPANVDGLLLDELRVSHSSQQVVQCQHAPCCCPAPQIMHVLVALAMWQLHLGADAEHQRLTALLDGSLACPAPVWWRLLA